MATSPQILTIGKILYRSGLGFGAAGRYSKLAEQLTTAQASRIISTLMSQGRKAFDFGGEDGNDNVWTDYLNKCGTCGKNREPINDVNSCSC